MRDAARYVALLAALWMAVSHGGDWLMQTTVRSFDPVVLTLPFDSASVDTRHAAGRPASEAASGDAGEADVDFDHARPAPKLFERISAREADRLKASVHESIVAEGSEGWYHGHGGTYRTLCVRLCDGAYFPVSFSTTRNWFARDEAVCKSKCGAPARLFVAPNPGGSPESMRDRNGASYVALPTAFQFRKGKVAGCSCRPEAWESASMERHRGYEAAAANVAVATSSPAGQSAANLQRVAGWNSADALSASRLVDPGSTAGSQVSVVDVLHGYATDDMPAPSVAFAEPVIQKSTIDEVMPRRSQEIVTAALSTVPALPAAATHRAASAEAALKPVPPQVAVKARTVKSSSKRSGGAKRRPVPHEDLAIGTPAVVAPVGLAVQPSAQVPAQAPKAALTWGVGPNSRSAPRGHTAHEVFARNFY